MCSSEFLYAQLKAAKSVEQMSGVNELHGLHNAPFTAMKLPSDRNKKVTFIITAALDLLLSVSQAMPSSVNSRPMWKEHCGGLVWLCWLSRPWSPDASTGYWLQPQTTYDQYIALPPLQSHWSSIAFHERLQKWSLRHLVRQRHTDNYSERERVFCECPALFVILTFLKASFVENTKRLHSRFALCSLRVLYFEGISSEDSLHNLLLRSHLVKFMFVSPSKAPTKPTIWNERWITDQTPSKSEVKYDTSQCLSVFVSHRALCSSTA